ncbi:hypothetical protein [Variovorax sp. CCNWLW225]|uniref:hypothetical protein n=1 Tax=Variovorax sp. CCNWLW225 TaxID=3127462 RepID=UPI0030768E2E
MLTWSEPGAPTMPPIPSDRDLGHYQIIRRNGAVVPFEPTEVAVAMMKAFLAVHKTLGVDGLESRFRGLWQSRWPELSEFVIFWAERLMRVRQFVAELGIRYFSHTRQAQTRRAICKARASTAVLEVRGFFCAAKANLRNAP